MAFISIYDIDDMIFVNSGCFLTKKFVNLLIISDIFNERVSCITLPLISYGGTSIVVTMASMGILLNISKR